jgi:hemolysin activation/secretion protein
VLTLGYVVAPDAPGGVNVESFSAGFRKPFYGLGDSLDVIVGSSSVNVPANVIAPGGVLSMNGKGEVLALRWNHLFPRQGEYRSKLIFGFDQKNLLNPCTSGGAPLVTAGCVSLYETVASATYSGQWQTVGLIADYNLGLFQNMGWGAAQESWRYTYAAGNRMAKREFNYVQAGGNLSYLFSWGGMFHAGLASQYSPDPLPSAEQFNLAGYSAVRGFNERAVTADSGYVLNLELYSQDLAPWLKLSNGTLKALTFIDMAAGFNTLTPNATYINDNGIRVPASGNPNERVNLASFGVGFRYALGKDITARFDWARIMHSAPVTRGTQSLIDTDWRAHFGLTYSY